MDPEKNRLPDRKKQLDEAKKDKTECLVTALICGAVAVFSVVSVIPATADEFFQELVEMLKYTMPVWFFLTVLNVFLYFRFKKKVRILSEQHEEELNGRDVAEDPEEK